MHDASSFGFTLPQAAKSFLVGFEAIQLTMVSHLQVTKIGGMGDAEFAAADAEARKRYLEMTKTPTKLDVTIQSDDQVPSPSASVQHGDAAEEDTSGSDGPVEDVEETQANGVAVG